MKLLIDARSARTPSGLYVLKGLASHWRNDPRVEAVTAVVRRGFDERLLLDGVETEQLPREGLLSHVTTAISRLADKHHADVIFSPNATAPPDGRVVLFFQDLYHFEMPDERVPLRVIAGEKARGLWRTIASPRCLVAVTVSEHLARHVRTRVRLPVAVIPHGIEVNGTVWTGGGSHLLVMGGIGSRKGEDHAIRSWASVTAPERAGAHLEIIGVEPAFRRDELKELAKALGCADSVSITATVPRHHFLERIASSMVSISCTTFESFGLPVAEALVIGAPVACTDIPAHRELVARARGGEMFAPGNVAALAAVMKRVLQGAAPRVADARQPDWGWAARASQHLDAYLEAITERRGASVRN
ncbi:MAG: glycosyltransferase [Gemmatimonadaceae bacterium]